MANNKKARTQEHMIKTDNLVFRYQISDTGEGDGQNTEPSEDITALNGVDIQIEKGDFVAILGHNGSGKSTLAKHLNALLQPTGGTVWIKGLDTKEEENIWHIRQSAGMVFQNPDNQIIATIVEDDVAFGPENLGIAPKEIRKRVVEAVTSVKMQEYLKQSPHFLSGGQKQRVAIAGILAMKPDCIILDEPTAMLDPSGRREVMETIQRLNKEEDITIILITHYMEEAVQAKRVIVMEQGSVVMDDIPKEVFRNVAQMKALGLDVPQVTECSDLLKQAGVLLPDGILTIEEMVDAVCHYK